MKMKGLLYVLIVLSLSIMHSLASVTIKDCPLVVQENTEDFMVTCDGIRATEKVTWSHKTNDAGSCDPLPGRCQSKLAEFMVLSRPTDTVSTLTIRNATRSLYGGATLKCTTLSGVTPTDTDSCSVDVVYGADVTSCNIQRIKTDSSWIVEGQCVISKVYSTFGRYTCDLRHSDGDSVETSVNVTEYSPVLDHGTPPYASGTCFFSTPLPSTLGVHTYAVVVSPGATRKEAGHVEVALSSASPNISCTSSTGQFIKVNSDISCTCSASDLGKPPGRLLGYLGDDLVVSGDHGNSILTYPRKKIDQQDDGVFLRCTLITGIPGHEDKDTTAIYRISLSYEAEVSALTLNDSSSMLTVQEADSVQLLCLARGVPTPTIRLFQSRKDTTHILAESKGTSLTYKLTAVCEDSGNYSCMAENTLGISSSTVPLSVRCAPRLTPANQDFKTITYEGNTSTLVFRMLAYPPPDRQDIVYLGQRGVGATMIPRENTVAVLCSPGATSWIHTCDVTVDRMVPDDGGFYRVSVANPVGQMTFTFYVFVKGENSSAAADVESLELNGGNSSLTITESETDFVKITCITRGNPTPRVQLRKQQDTSDSDSDVLAQGTTEVLMSAIPTRCDSTGNYTCEADNSLGQSQQTIELTVLCPPRITTESTNIPTLNFSGTPLTFTLNVVAFPRPNLTSLVSLGADLIHVKEQLLVNETMTMDCSETSVPWRVACVITVQDTMTKEDEGFYRAVVMNALGRVDFTFVVLFRDQEENQTPRTGAVRGGVESDADSRYAAVVLGVLLAVFAIAVVVLLIVVIRMWRRQQNASKEAGRHFDEVDTRHYPYRESHYDEIPPGGIYSLNFPARQKPRQAPPPVPTEPHYTPPPHRKQSEESVTSFGFTPEIVDADGTKLKDLDIESGTTAGQIQRRRKAPKRGPVDSSGYLLPHKAETLLKEPPQRRSTYLTPVLPDRDLGPSKWKTDEAATDLDTLPEASLPLEFINPSSPANGTELSCVSLDTRSGAEVTTRT